MKKLVSIIIPCYNEASVIQQSLNRVSTVMENIRNEFSYEIICVDDGSSDETVKTIDQYAARSKKIRLLSFSRNFGHQAAVSAGIHECRGDYAVIIDADLQDPPELIPQMLTLCSEKHANGVYAVRSARKGESVFKKLTAAIFYRFLAMLSEYDIPLDTGDFRLIDKQVIDAYKLFHERQKYIRGLISWLGFKQVALPYVRDKRYSGETKYSLGKMLRLAMTSMLYFTRKPLIVSMVFGFITIVIGLLLTVFVFAARFLPVFEVVRGWSSIVIVVIFFGGVQLFSVGILGLYIGSIFDEVKGRPEYILKKKMRTR